LVFPFLLLITIFFATRMWFGPMAAAFAVALAVFEPNLTAHGPLVTTDMAATATIFLTIVMAWRYLALQSASRLVLLGFAMGLALASKHSAVLVTGMVLAQFAADYLIRRRRGANLSAARLLGGWAAALLIAIAVLWATYGFRYAALPDPHVASFNMESDLQASGQAGTSVGRAILFIARHHFLPESYLAGLVYVKAHASRETFFLGKQVPHGVWYYFPVTLSIKTTLPFLLFVFVSLVSLSFWRRYLREYVFLAIPVAMFLGAAMMSSMNIGIRHILPIFPFLIVLAAAAGAWYASRARVFAIVCALLLFGHVASYLHCYPNEIAYANEAWGGPQQLYHHLGDSNLDWGQSLYAVRDYVKGRGIAGGTDCWIAWFGARKPQKEGVPCKSLPGPWFIEAADPVLPEVMPEHFEGTILISASLLDYDLFPYGSFWSRSPRDVIAGSVLVFQGSFDSEQIAAERRLARGWWFLNHDDAAHAVEELAIAEQHAHTPGQVHSVLAWARERAGVPKNSPAK
jgi:hypothetical protein